MITKQDILDRSAEWKLRPELVEKDYVLGWLLAGIASLPDFQEGWVFKGGTCIKKCFFETYRFSEDLDFSLQPHAPYAEAEIRDALVSLTRIVNELSGAIIFRRCRAALERSYCACIPSQSLGVVPKASDNRNDISAEIAARPFRTRERVTLDTPKRLAASDTGNSPKHS